MLEIAKAKTFMRIFQLYLFFINLTFSARRLDTDLVLNRYLLVLFSSFACTCSFLHQTHSYVLLYSYKTNFRLSKGTEIFNSSNDTPLSDIKLIRFYLSIVKGVFSLFCKYCIFDQTIYMNKDM